jgi:anhydro-N-acetylmuramic acid kinase
MNKVHTVVGLMSGTSLDGVDLVCCNFTCHDRWEFEIIASSCIPYPVSWKKQLMDAFHLTSEQLKPVDVAYGEYLGSLLNQFILDFQLNLQLIASHGHTIFHKPDEGFTLQIGNGQTIAKTTGIMVVNNFRQADIEKGGQGAPLVPVGDRLLFGDYGICLNIGGIANISFEKDYQRLAFDVCPANQVLNKLANEAGLSFDGNGILARNGRLNLPLLEALNRLPYYISPYPKSLGREWVDDVFMPVINKFDDLLINKLNTACVHIASQIAEATNNIPKTKMLVTGGGAHNGFLMNCIRKLTHHEIIIPDERLIDFKESVVFALLGLLRVLGQVNCYASVTGANEDSSTGDIYLP